MGGAGAEWVGSECVVIGQAAAALLSNVMNSRRCMCPPSSGDSIVSAQMSTSLGAETGIKTANVTVGSIAA
jgi:hypothetical protein